MVYFDRYDEKANKEIRHFVLLNEGVKLMYEPWGWKNEWYVDLIKIERKDDHTFELVDMYIDIIIEGNGPTYRVIDLEEYADALMQGTVKLEDVKDHFMNLQRFLDNYLHRGKQFPPSFIQELLKN